MSDDKLFTDGTYTVELLNGIDDLTILADSLWNVLPESIKYNYNEENNYWEVYIPAGDSYRFVGALNFNPHED